MASQGAGGVGGIAAGLLRRERVLLLAALALVSALAWWQLVVDARAMDCTRMEAIAAAGIGPGSAAELARLFGMWVVMMVAMMLPSAAPAILIYEQVAQKAAREGRALAPGGLFAGGYLVAWTLFSVGATAAQVALEQLALLSPTMVATSPALGAGLLVAAGLYQLTPWKDACLRHCRTPAPSFARRWRPGRGGALRMGIEHGAFCVGCCAVLMALLVGGVMNLLWIAALSAFVLLEKVAPLRRGGAKFSGAALLASGLAALAGWIRLPPPG
jgi:predicted metal-binding membrane protein